MKIKVTLKILAIVTEFGHVTLGLFIGSKLTGVVAVKDWEGTLD